MRFVILTLALAIGTSFIDHQQQVGAQSSESLEGMVVRRWSNHHGHNQHRRHPKPSDKGPSSHHKKGSKNRKDESDTGLLNRTYDKCRCPDPHSTKERPNGSIKFLNCGINGDGWKPPAVQMDHLKMISTKEAVKKPTFKRCHEFLEIFEQVAEEHNVPAMILMSIAMQESHCNPKTLGPNGEIGMMQLTKENCKEDGSSIGDAWHPHVNIKLGAKQFQGYLKHADGNVLAALGQYNGWELGMTEGKARSEKYGCYAQNNLDYLDSMVNGWLQGKDGYSKAFRTFNNLAHCGNHE